MSDEIARSLGKSRNNPKLGTKSSFGKACCGPLFRGEVGARGHASDCQ